MINIHGCRLYDIDYSRCLIVARHAWATYTIGLKKNKRRKPSDPNDKIPMVFVIFYVILDNGKTATFDKLKLNISSENG